MRRAIAIVLGVFALLCVALLALSKPDIPYEELEAVYADQDSQFMTLESGLKIHYTDSGQRNRAVIVLVHGFAASLHTWEIWRNELKDEYRVITVDLPGHGLSRAESPDMATTERFSDVVFELLAAREVETMTLVGSSLGGNVVARMAVAAPERVEGVALIGSSGLAQARHESQGQYLIFSLLRAPVLGRLLRDLDLSGLTRSGLEESFFDPSFATEEMVERYIALSRAPGHRATMFALLTRPRTFEDVLDTAGLDMPILLMWGRNDGLVDVANADASMAAVPEAQNIIYDNVGHLPHEEIAATSLADMKRFLLRVEWAALAEQYVVPAGDPRLVEDRID